MFLRYIWGALNGRKNFSHQEEDIMTLRTLCAVLIAGLLLPPALQAQEKRIRENDVPKAVLAAFHKAYPGAQIKGASTEVEHGKKYFEIESMDGTQARDVLYLADGTAAEVEEVTAVDALPATVKEAVGKEFPKAEITKAERVTKGTASSFEIHVKSGSKKGSVVVDPAGKILEKHALAEPKKKSTGKKDDESEEQED